MYHWAVLNLGIWTTNWGGMLVLNDAEYQTAMSNAAALTERQVQPAQVHPLIDDNTTPLKRAQLEASQRAQLQAWYMQEATDEAIVDRIIEENIETHYIEELKNKYTTYTNEDIKSVLHHIKHEWVQITNLDKEQAKKEFNQPWDMTSQITMFIIALNERVDYCHLVKCMDVNDDSKVVVFVASMYASEMFDATEMSKWERAIDKSWAAAQAYFIKLYKKKRVFNDQRANQRQGYDSAHSISEQTATRHFNQHSPRDSGKISLPEYVLTATTGMTINEQQAMAEYTNVLEEKLGEREKEFAAAMTTTQTNVMEQMQTQQKAMTDQQQKFMEMCFAKMGQQNNGGGFPR